DAHPVFRCIPVGLPRQPAPQKIVQTPKELVFYNPTSTRFVPVDGRERDPGDSDYRTWSGIPLGHWEGDTLIVESVGFTDESWIRWQGYFHPDDMKVSERYGRGGA